MALLVGTAKWTEQPDLPLEPFAGASLIMLADGMALLCGGMRFDMKFHEDAGCVVPLPSHCVNDVWAFADSTWTQLPNAPWAARSGAMLTALPDGSALFCGGELGVCLNDVWVFGDRAWTQLPDAPWEARTCASLVTLTNGTALLCGGLCRDGQILNDVWTFADGTWLQLPDPPWPARAFMSLSALPDGSALLCGGKYAMDPRPNNYCDDVWSFADGAWSQLPDAPWEPRAESHMVTLADGRALLCGGYGNGERLLSDAWLYAERTWIELPDVPWPARKHSCLTALSDGMALLCGGNTNFDAMSSAWIFTITPPRVISCIVADPGSMGLVVVRCHDMSGEELASFQLGVGQGVFHLRSELARALDQPPSSLQLLRGERILEDEKWTCSICDGKGRIGLYKSQCRSCKGKGFFGNAPCFSCCGLGGKCCSWTGIAFLDVGTRVVLHSLVSAQNLNGVEGTCQRFDGRKRRWEVKLGLFHKMIHQKSAGVGSGEKWRNGGWDEDGKYDWRVS